LAERIAKTKFMVVSNQPFISTRLRENFAAPTYQSISMKTTGIWNLLKAEQKAIQFDFILA